MIRSASSAIPYHYRAWPSDPEPRRRPAVAGGGRHFPVQQPVAHATNVFAPPRFRRSPCSRLSRFCCSAQLAGEGVTRGLGLPVPGPVIGLVLMAVGLLIAQRFTLIRADVEATPLGRTATGLLGHLSLLFVPAGVGIVQHGGTLLRNGVALAAALAVSTVLSLAVPAPVFRAVARLVRAPETGA